MRGDPPLIGGAKCARSGLSAKSAACGKLRCGALRTCRGDAGIRRARRPRYNPPHRPHFACAAIDSQVRSSRRIVLVAAGVAVAAAAAFALFTFIEPPPVVTRSRLGTPEHAKELVVLVRPAPVVYFPGPAGKIEGLDVDLLRLYAAEKKLAVRFIPVDDVAKLLAALDDGDGHIGAGGLLRPLSPTRSEALPRGRSLCGPPAGFHPGRRRAVVMDAGLLHDRARPDLQHRRLQASELERSRR